MQSPQPIKANHDGAKKTSAINIFIMDDHTGEKGGDHCINMYHSGKRRNIHNLAVNTEANTIRQDEDTLYTPHHNKQSLPLGHLLAASIDKPTPLRNQANKSKMSGSQAPPHQSTDKSLANDSSLNKLLLLSNEK
jgi:hypothetical protein